MSELPTNKPFSDGDEDEDNFLEFPNIDGYLVQQQLGQGAYGRVFKAIDTSVSAPVAIKVLNPIASQKKDLRERFDREIKAYYAVRDSRIVQPRNHGVISQGVYRGCPFVVMEYMDGGSFESWLLDHPTGSMSALRVAVQVLIQVCEGLMHLHESEIVHRDLKPANILLAGVAINSDGTRYPKQVRIADFGLAAFLGQSRELSKTGMGAGTPAYMSPEQFVDAKNITPASDQYAIGVMLYQLLCSRRPWQSSAEESEAPGILEVKARSKILPPPPSSSTSKIDKQLKKVCLRCLEPKPEDRYRDAEELAEDLRKWMRGETIADPGNPIRWFYHRQVAQPIKRNPGRFLLAIFFSILLATSAALGWNRYAYHWPYVQYFDSIVERSGAFEGNLPITEEAALTRQTAFKVTRAGRFATTTIVELVNGNKDRFHIRVNDSLRSLIEDWQWQRLEYTYNQDGTVDSIHAFDKNLNALWRKVFTAPNQAKFLVASPEGLQLDKADSSEVSILKYDWDENGYLAKVRYFNRQGLPTIGLGGGYGLSYLRAASREITEVSILGPEGLYPMSSSLGFATVRRSESPGMVSVSYWDHNGARATDKIDGYSYAELSVDKSKQIKSIRCFHPDQTKADSRVLSEFGIDFPLHELSLQYGSNREIERLGIRSSQMKDEIQLRLGWDKEGNLISARYFSTDGKAACLFGQVHGFDRNVNPSISRLTYIGLAGEPVPGPDGYATRESRLNSKLQVEHELFFSSNGSPAIVNGVHRTDYSINVFGAIETESHFGAEGALALHDKGYATKKSEYDSFGRLRAESYLGTGRNPIVTKAGYQRRDFRHDEFGNLVGESYWGLKDSPVLVDGRHRWRSEYDKRGNKTLEESFDMSGHRIKNSDGIHLWTAEYDERSRMTKKSFFGPNAEPILTSDGLHFWTAKYNVAGDQIEGKAFGIRGEPVVGWTGYHRWTGEYDQNGKQSSGKLFDIDGTPLPYKDGYYTWKSKFDNLGRLQESMTFDAAGKPVIDANGDFCFRVTYDNEGRKTKEEHFGIVMEPVLNREGLFRVTFEYDDQGRQIGKRAFGMKGEPVNAWSGFHRLETHWDNQGRISEEMFFGTEDERVASTDGFHRQVNEYDNRGIMVGASFYGSENQPVYAYQGYHRWKGRFNEQRQQTEGIAYGTGSVVLGFGNRAAVAWEGYHKWSKEFDERGRAVAARKFDTSSNPALNSGGYFLDTATWDERGNKTSSSCFGIKEEPVVCAEGWHRWVAEYDARDNQASISYFGVSSEAFETKAGYHRIVREFDRFGRKSAERAYGTNNKPCLAWTGYHLKRYRYDSFSNQVRVSYFDTNEKPVLSTEGIHALEYQYNAHRDEIEAKFFDTDSKPVEGCYGYHCRRQIFNERGTVVEISYWNPSMEPQLGPDGYCKKTLQVDRRQLPTHTSYWDFINKPCDGPLGAHLESHQYDDRGNIVCGKAFDAAGSPAEFSDGYHAWKSEFDNRQQQLTGTIFGLDGSPVNGRHKFDGHHRWSKEYDVAGNQILGAYLGANGGDVRFKGHHKWRAKYSPTGEQTNWRAYGEDGSPVECDDGYHSWMLIPDSGEYEFRSVADTPLASVAVIEDVPDNSMLARLGFRKGDAILAVEDKLIDNHLELAKVLAKAIRGEYGIQPTISVNRCGQTLQLQVYPNLLVGATRTKCKISQQQAVLSQ